MGSIYYYSRHDYVGIGKGPAPRFFRAVLPLPHQIRFRLFTVNQHQSPHQLSTANLSSIPTIKLLTTRRSQIFN